MKSNIALSATSALALLVAIGGVVALPSTVFAQQPGSGASQSQTGLEEVVVTARRREERVQTVPVAITAFSQKDLEEHHITQIRDLARAVPSLGVSQSQSDQNAPYASQLNLRGLSGTVIYFAEVPVGRGDAGQAGLTQGNGPQFYYDLDHAEIDKGPQGTLFGKNSIGGLISLEPKHPTDDFEGYVQAGFGNYNDRNFEGAINVPVVADKLLVRIAGQSDTRDGYTKVYDTDTYLDDRNYQTWRVGITLRPSDDFENYFLYDGYWQHSNGSSTILESLSVNHVLANIGAYPHLLPVTLTGSGPVPGDTSALGYLQTRYSLFPTLTDVLAEQQALGDRTEIGRVPPGLGKDYFYGFTDNARWDVSDDLTVKNIASARITKQLGTADDSGTSLYILTVGDPVNPHGWEDDSIQYTEEFQVQGKAVQDRLNYVFGGYVDFSNPLGDELAESVAATSLSYTHYHNSSRSQAMFGHAIYDLSDFVQGLRLTGGYRYTWDFTSISEEATKKVDRVLRNAKGQPTNCENAGSDLNCVGAPDAHYSAPGWNLSLDEQLDQDTLLYVRSGNAYRPGGINLAVPPAFQQYQPEHVTDVELGVKSEWTLFGIQGRTNFDMFHTDYKSIQVPQLVLVPSITPGGTPTVNQIIRNSASATIQGFELDATIVPVKGLEISPQYSLVQAAYGQYPSNAGAVANPPFLYVPRIKYGVTGVYHLPLDESVGDVSLTAMYSFYGHQYDSNLLGEPYSITPSHDQLDMKVDWNNVFGRSFDASFYMTNVTNNTYVTGAFPIYVQFGFESLVYSAPRMFGFNLRYRFGPGLNSGM